MCSCMSEGFLRDGEIFGGPFTGRVISWQIAQSMKKKQKLTKTAMASRMKTSRATVNRLLDENDTGVTLATLARASLAVGVPLKLELSAQA